MGHSVCSCNQQPECNVPVPEKCDQQSDLAGAVAQSSARPPCPVPCPVSCGRFFLSAFVVELGRDWGGENSYIKRH